MTKLIKRYKQGNKSPDHDPDNPYHCYSRGNYNQLDYIRGYATGGQMNTDVNNQDNPWIPPEGLYDYRQAAGKVTDIPITQAQRDRALAEYEELSQRENPSQYRLVRAYNDAVRAGLEGEELGNYLYHTNSAWLTKEQQEQERLYRESQLQEQARIGRNYLLNTPNAENTKAGKAWLQWAKDNNINIYQTDYTDFEQQEQARQKAQKRQKESQFVEDVKERRGYEGLRKFETVAATFPLMLAAGVGEGAAGLFKALPSWLKNSLLENSIEYLAGYGIDKLSQTITDNGEGLYRWFQEHPEIANTVELVTSFGESGSGVGQRAVENFMDKYGSQYVFGGNDPISKKLRMAARARKLLGTVNAVTHGVNSVYGGMAASNVDTYGANRDNVIDAGQGLIPRAISDPNASSDELMLGIGSLLNVGPDVYQAVSPQDNGPLEKATFATGGKLKLIPRALRGISFSVILQPAVADNTRYVRPYTSIEIAKSKKAYEQEQLQKLIEAAQERLPLLKADTRSTEQRQRDHNRAIQLEVKQKANELAANFGRALGANHDMTVDEVNQNTLNTANLMGYMVAPYLMTTLESGYYLGTGRPKEAAITAGIGYGLPALNKPLANVSNTTKAIVVSNRLKKGIKNTTLPAQEPLIDVNPIYNFIDNGTPFNGKLPLIGYVKGNLELFPNRPLILRPEKSYHTIDRAYLESSLPDFVKDSGLRNMLKQTYESISESTPSSELVTSINHTLGIEPKIPNDKFITGGVDKVKWLNDKPIFISKTPEEIYHPKFVRDAYKKPNEQVVDETYDIFRQRILDKFGIKLKENYDAKDIEDAFYSLETPTTDDFSKVMHNERWYNPDFNDDQKLFAEYFNQYFGLKNKNFVSYIDLKNVVKEGLQFGIDYLKSPGFTERATNMLNKYGFSYSPSDFKLNSRKVTWMPEFMNADSSLLFGLSSRRRLPFRLGGTATHEVFHWNPKFNTRINSSKGITLTKPADSPYYSNNYNNIPEDVKAILRPNKEKLIARELKGLGDLEHDAEISESYSDLEELRYNLKKEGIFDSFKSGEKFDLHMLDLFRKTKRGKTDRFIDLHNDDQIIKAVNEIAQNGNEEISYV